MTRILDQFGRPFAPSQRPETRELAAVSIRDRYSSYPADGLTPGRLRALLHAADFGWQRELMELFEEMEERDPHLGSILQTRKLALTGLAWDIQPASEAAEDGKIADFVREEFAGIADFQDDLFDLLDAIGKGYSMVEILWRIDLSPARFGIADLKWIHPKRISFLNQMLPRILTDDEPGTGIEPGPFQTIFHRPRVRSGLVTRGGVLRTVVLPYLLKNYALKDWAVFNEVFGMPLRLGKYDPSATPADRAALAQALRSLGSDAAGIISKNTEIEFVEAGLRGSGTMIPYHVLFDVMNGEMSKAVLGQTLTSDAATGSAHGGGLAMAKVHDEVRTDLRDADNAALCRTIKAQIIRPLVGFNFGWDKAEKQLPLFVLQGEDSPDLLQDSEVVRNLASVPGAAQRIPASYINEHFGIPEPEKGEETLGTIPAVGTEPPTPGPDGKVPSLPPDGKVPAAPVEANSLRTILPLRDGGGLVLIPQDQVAISRVQELDDLAAQAAAAADTEIMRMLAPVKKLIAGGQSLEEIKGELLKLYSQIEVEGLVTLIHEARMRAFMHGRMTS